MHCFLYAEFDFHPTPDRLVLFVHRFGQSESSNAFVSFQTRHILRLLFFSNAVKSGLKYDGSEESERMEDRLHNLYKLPFVILPLVVLLADYMFAYLSVYSVGALLLGFLLIAFVINRQVDQWIRRGGEILEKVNVSD